MLSWLRKLLDLVDQSRAAPPVPAADPDARLARAGELAIAEADRLWALDVYDPPKTDKSKRADRSRAVIDAILRDAGWGWMTPYLGNGEPQWCGLFAAACWRAAGINPSMLATYWASTYRLRLWARYHEFGGRPNPAPKEGPRRLIAQLDERSTSLPFVPRPGDLLVVGNGGKADGDHITLVVGYDAGRRVFSTLEGNGIGLGPDGKRREGIVRGERRLGGAAYCARWLYRPAPVDLLAVLPALATTNPAPS